MLPDRTAVMGIVNVTPDSFSDGGYWTDPNACIDHVLDLVTQGADLIDVGAESTRPGADAVPANIQLQRLAPVLDALGQISVPVSVDTRLSEVAGVCADAGIEIINDVSGGRFDPAMVTTVSERDVIIVVTHSRGTPASMDRLTAYGDPVAEVAAEWQEQKGAFSGAGIPDERIWCDPGLGFAKSGSQSWQLVYGVRSIAGRHLLLLGPSRKRMLGLADIESSERDPGTHAAVTICAQSGADIVRVHDVAGARQVIDVVGAAQMVA